MTHVFISYVREDAPTVNKLASELKSHGVKVWLDRNNISVGVQWDDAIKNAIREGNFFLACFSNQYHNKAKTYMNEELMLAIEELRLRPIDRAWFLPVLLDECNIPDRSIGAGKSLANIQYASLHENWDEGLRKILAVVNKTPEPVKKLPQEPGFWSYLRTMSSYMFEIVAIVWLAYMLRDYKWQLAVLAGGAGAFGGSLLWQYLCKYNGWGFHLGHRTEPYGIYAAIWGSLTTLPIISSAVIVCDPKKLHSPRDVLLWLQSAGFLFVCLYTLLAGLAGVIFYGWRRQCSTRTWIESLLARWAEETRELLIIVLWSVIMTALPALALLIYCKKQTMIFCLIPKQTMIFCLIPTLIPTFVSVGGCILALILFFWAFPPEKDLQGQIRGVIAGTAIRGGLYIGLLIVLDPELCIKVQRVLGL